MRTAGNKSFKSVLPPRGISEEDQEVLKKMDRIHMKYPFKGSRRLAHALSEMEGMEVGRKRGQRLTRAMGMPGAGSGSRDYEKGQGAQDIPVFARGEENREPGQVWAADITYIPMSRGFVYLMCLMDWHSRKALSFRVSSTIDTGFCVEALEEALHRYEAPEIFNTDQESQFTSEEFTNGCRRESLLPPPAHQGRRDRTKFVHERAAPINMLPTFPPVVPSYQMANYTKRHKKPGKYQ